MGGDINVLLQLAVDRCTALEDLVDDLVDQLGEVVEELNVLGDDVEEQAGALQQLVEEARPTMNGSRDEIEGLVEQAGQALGALPTAADEVERELKELLGQAGDDLERLAQVRAQGTSDRQAAVQEADAAFAELTRDVQAFRAGIDARFQPAEPGVRDLDDALQGARKTVAVAHDAVEEATAELDGAVDRLSRSAASSVHDLTQGMGAASVRAVNEVTRLHNEGTARFRTALTSQTPSDPDPADTWVSEPAKPLQEEIAEYAATTRPSEEEVTNAAGAIIGYAEPIGSTLAEVDRMLQETVELIPI
jgi:chromosome segregation ATPase